VARGRCIAIRVSDQSHVQTDEPHGVRDRKSQAYEGVSHTPPGKVGLRVACSMIGGRCFNLGTVTKAPVLCCFNRRG
jgi:hypothetical protein